MAKNTKIIKLTNGTLTYVPVTLASAVQYSYGNNKAMSVQEAIGTMASSVIDQNVSVSSYLKGLDSRLDILEDAYSTHKISAVNLTYVAGGVQTTGVHGTGSIFTITPDTGISITQNSNGIKIKSIAATPNAADLKVSDGTTSKTVFNSNESVEKTLTVKGDTGTPITTTVSQSGNTSTVTIKHSNSGVTAGTYGTNTLTTIGSGTTGNLIVPQYTVNAYGHVTASSNKTISVNIPDLSGLTGAMHYKGSVSTLPTTYTNYSVGDVVVMDTKEYVLEKPSSSYLWRELGDEGSHALKGTTTTTPGSGLVGDVIYAYVSGYSGTISHADQSGAGNEDSTKALNASGGTATDSVDVITGIKRDAFGHVVGITSGKTQNTHLLSYNIVGAASGMVDSAQSTNGNVNLRHIEGINGSYTATSTHKITGASGVSVTSDASGNITITGPGSKDNNYSQIIVPAQATSTTAEVAGGLAVTLAPASSADKLSIESVNKWVQVKGTNGAANSDKIQIAHDVLWTGTPSGTQKLYKFTYDNAGHVTNLTEVSADKVIGSVTSNYKIVEGNAIDDLDAGFLSTLGLSGNSGNDIATGNQTTNNYYHS